MDLLLQKMHSKKEYEDRERPWIVRNKRVGLLEFKDGKTYPCVSLFTSKMGEVPQQCWKLLQVKGLKKTLICSKTLTFISSAKCEFHYDKTNTVVTHAFIDCISDKFKKADKRNFWKHTMELYFKLINSHYETLKEMPLATIEEITDTLQNTNLIEKEKAKVEKEEKPKVNEETNNPEEIED